MITRTTAGFTLIEMMVVATLFTIFSLASLWTYNRMFERSNAAQVAADFQRIKSAWRLYLLDTNEASPLESSFPGSNPDAGCHGEPPLFNTDLFSDVTGNTYWSGPYLKTEPLDPWGWHYTLDNDGDIYTFDTSSPSYQIDAGVNAMLQWCPGQDDIRARYIEMAPRIDKIIDNGDGASAGSFRWDSTTNGGYYFLLSEN